MAVGPFGRVLGPVRVPNADIVASDALVPSEAIWCSVSAVPVPVHGSKGRARTLSQKYLKLARIDVDVWI